MSQTQQYEECPWKFYLRRVERVQPRPAGWSHHGTAFHSSAEAVEASGRTMTADEAVSVFSEEYSTLVNRDLEREPDTDRWLSAGRSGGEDIEVRYHLGQQQTRRYVEWTTEHQPEVWTTPSGKPALELHFMAELGGVKVQGYIDQLIAEPDDTLRVRDLKTGSTKSKFQLETYKAAVEQVYNVPVERGDWYLAKNGNLSRPVQLGHATEERVGERFAAMDAGVKRGDFPARPGFLCRFCDVSHACTYK